MKVSPVHINIPIHFAMVSVLLMQLFQRETALLLSFGILTSNSFLPPFPQSSLSYRYRNWNVDESLGPELPTIFCNVFC